MNAARRFLIDTNILVYRYDSRYPDKKRIATEAMRTGLREGTARLAHQAIIEFISAVTKGSAGSRLLDPMNAGRELAKSATPAAVPGRMCTMKFFTKANA